MQQMDIEEMVTNRKVLPFSPALQSLYHRDIGSSSETAQQYFDQAMVLSAAFNHDEAIRSLQFALMHDVEFMSFFPHDLSLSLSDPLGFPYVCALNGFLSKWPHDSGRMWYGVHCIP